MEQLHQVSHSKFFSGCLKRGHLWCGIKAGLSFNSGVTAQLEVAEEKGKIGYLGIQMDFLIKKFKAHRDFAGFIFLSFQRVISTNATIFWFVVKFSLACLLSSQIF